MNGYHDMVRRQKALGDFGEFALESDSLDQVLTRACQLVAEVLGTGRAKILEIQKKCGSLLVRAGVGWEPDIVGKMRLPMKEHSSETFAINEGKPVIMRDLRQEHRFDIPDFMKRAGVLALANVPIYLPGRRAYGLLQVDATEPRDFGDEDTEFLRTYATILGPVIDRLLNLREMIGAEERFRLIVNSTRDYAIFLTDEEDRITDWLPGAEAVYGFTAAEAIGQPSAILFTPEDRERHVPREEIDRARRDGWAPNIRWHYRKGGRRVFIEGTVSALYDAEGAVRGFLKIGQDVTERRRVEEALRESEEHLGRIFAAAAVGLSELDPDGRFQRVNAELCRILGRSEDELLRLGVADVTYDDDLPRSHEAVRQALVSGRPTSLDKRYVRPDGSLVWANSSITALPASDTRPSSLLVVTVDLTARHEAETALRDSEERLRTAARVGRLGLWDWNTRTGEVHWSDEHYAMMGYAPGEVKPTYATWRSCIHPDDRAGAEAALRAAEESRREYVHEYRILHLDGAVRWLSARGRFFYDEGGAPIRMIGAMIDTTERREWEEIQKVMVAELQHRTRNLIAVVRGIANETIKQTGPTEAFRAAFSDRLSALSRVQNLLSRADVEPISISALVGLELEALGADGSGGRVVVAGPDVYLRNSTVQTLSLALHELATNARKYGALSHACGRLSVTWAERHDAGERRLVLEWVETGSEHILVQDRSSETGRGYGRELIEQALPHTLGARTSYMLTATGVSCTIDLPSRPSSRRERSHDP